MPTTVPAQLLSALKARKFPTVGKLFASGADFQAWTPTGHWIANDGATIAKIFEVWFSPGVLPSVVEFSNEAATTKSATLEYEISWKTQPDDQPRILRQYITMTLKGDKITAARVYCAGLHTEFPEVDLEKQRRAKGLGGAKPPSSPKAIVAKAS